MPVPNRATVKNQILTAIKQEDFDEFFPDLRLISLSLRQVLHEIGRPFDHVYFIEEGLASILTSMQNGSTVEVGMVGAEGMVGMDALLGAKTAARQTIVQIPGSALRMSAESCKAAFDGSTDVRRVMHRFLESKIDLSSQTAACNRLHSIEQRCARWLLMSSDRIQSDSMPMTHEFLSSMLGVRRAGVSEVAEELQRSGLIQYRHGQLTITDREDLEATACECYRNDRARLNGLLRAV
jgi:CRP-like cAMP-binding protein